MHRAWESSNIKWQEEQPGEKDQSAQGCAVEGCQNEKHDTNLYNDNDCVRMHCIS